jgi:hypothetical protein
LSWYNQNPTLVLIMTSTTIHRILAAYEEAFRAMGCGGNGIAFVLQMLRRQERLLKSARNMTGLKTVLMREPEPSPEQLEAIVGVIRLLPYQLRKATLELGKKLPHSPGGRPRVLTPQDGREICAQIGALLGQGVSLSDAVRQMAAKHSVGEITIRRVWQKRGQGLPEVELPIPWKESEKEFPK